MEKQIEILNPMGLLMVRGWGIPKHWQTDLDWVKQTHWRMAIPKDFHWVRVMETEMMNLQTAMG
jgi:hypothetical protein